jgi:hypothetical protein
MTHFALTVLSHTPLWAWAILATLIALGAMQARDHVVTRRRLLIQPVTATALSLVAACNAFGLQAGVLASWVLGALIGAVLIRRLSLPRRVQALAGGRFAIGGSWAPMLLLLTIFWLRYLIAASLGVVPALAQVALFATSASVVYGVAAGMLAARAWRVLRQGQPAAWLPQSAAAVNGMAG